MAKGLYWEDVATGDEVTPLPKIPTTQMLVKWAGASGDFNPAHYEDAFANSQGLERVYVHGQLKRAWLCQLMTDWIGEKGILGKLSCQFRAVDWPRHMKTMEKPQEGDTWWCKGTVTRKYVKGDERFVDCDIWVENAKGEKTTPGKATVVLPSRGETFEKCPHFVIPTKVGIQKALKTLDSRLHGNDNLDHLRRNSKVPGLS